METEAVWVGNNLREGICVRCDIIGAAECHNGTALAVVRSEITDQQRFATVSTVNSATVGWVSEEETAVDFFAVVVSVSVKGQRVAQVHAKVGPQLHVVIDNRTAPNHGWRGHVLISIVDQRLRVSALL